MMEGKSYVVQSAKTADKCMIYRELESDPHFKFVHGTTEKTRWNFSLRQVRWADHPQMANTSYMAKQKRNMTYRLRANVTAQNFGTGVT